MILKTYYIGQIIDTQSSLRAPCLRSVFILFLHSNFQGVIITLLVELTPYSRVIFWGVILTPKRSLKNSFSGVKVTPDIEELK